MVVVVEVVVVEVVVVLVEAVVAAVVVLLLGDSEVSGETEPEDDSEGTASAEPEGDAAGAGSTEPEPADGATLGTGSACSVLGATGAEVVVVSVVSGRATVAVFATLPTAASVVAVSGLLSPPPEEQAEPTSPKTAAKAATETNFVCLIPKKPLTADCGFIF